ncbi:MAG TPA: hypothetical protein VFU71_10435, partial [Burkholderiaceae bacterium]|nr:hypothetical protein [Burkholderiaceae bacterium]
MTPPPSPTPRASRRRWLGLAIAALALIVLASALALLAHGARSEAGTRWLLQRVPGLTVSGVQGSLIGDALRIESLQWQGGATQPGIRIERLELLQPQWRLLPFAGAWLSLSASALSAQRVALRSPRESSPATGSAPPLRLPIGLSIDALTIAELQLDDAAAWRDIRAGIRLGANDGAEHRIEKLSLHNDRLRLSADGRIGTDAPSQLALQLQASPLSGTPWQANASAEGPLASFALGARLRSDERDPNAPQVDVQARVEPFASWPLAALQLSTRALDLGSLSSAAPRTRIDAQADIRSAGIDRPAEASLRVQNHEPGRWDAGRLPLRQAQVELGGTPSRLDRVDIRQFDAQLADERQAGGRVQGSGQWVGSELQLQVRLADVEPSRLLSAAPPLRAGGAVTVRVSGMPLPAAPGASAPASSAPAGRWQVRVDGALEGTLGVSAQPLRTQFELTADPDLLNLTQARVGAGEASAQLKLKVQHERNGGRPVWHVVGDGELNQVDPLPWIPNAGDSAWARGPHRINGRWRLDLQLPDTLGEQMRRQRDAALAALRGQLLVELADSLLAGLPMTARADVQGDGQALAVRASAAAMGNQATLEGRFAVDALQDTWRLNGALPALAALQPLSSLLPKPSAAAWPRAGTLTLQAQLDGRWPQPRGGSGSLQAAGVRAGEFALDDAQTRWRFGGNADAPIELTLGAKGMQHGAQRVDELQAKVDGTLREHRIAMFAETPA